MADLLVFYEVKVMCAAERTLLQGDVRHVHLRGHCNRVMLETCAAEGAQLQGEVREMCAAERAQLQGHVREMYAAERALQQGDVQRDVCNWLGTVTG